MEIKCNGIDMEKMANPVIRRDQFKDYDALINSQRRLWVKDNPTVYVGVRFKSNDDVMTRIVSACPSRDEFLDHMIDWVRAGLAECASADDWYAHEKQWGIPDIPSKDDDETDF